jgi:hypothetical protein
MNKQEALQKLASLEAETKALRALIEAPEVPALPVRWRPEDGGDYYQVAYDGWTYSYARERMKDREYAHGNCFQTEAHAEIASKAVSVTLKICAAAFAVDPDAGNFGSARRWSVVKRSMIPTECRWEAISHEFVPGVVIFVHTFEQAKEMAAILNAEGV